MRLAHLPIHPALQGYIEKLWVFETDQPVAADDMKLIVPNGLIKMVIPYRNGLTGQMEGCRFTSKENQLTLIGICDIPSTVETAYFQGQSSGTIGIEFSPAGAYRLLRLCYADVKNQICDLEDLFSGTARLLREEIANTVSVEGKVGRIQHFFLRSFAATAEDPIFAFCIRRIRASNGTIAIQQLEKETGYTSRWLNRKFTEKLGISPKNFAAIVRFQQYYQALATGNEHAFLANDFYQYYYDQSHFFKDFKRFTGLAPTRWASTKNDFGRIFYKE